MSKAAPISRRSTGDAGRAPVVTISLGVGENPAKRIGDPFEAELLRALVERGAFILIDKGAGGEEAGRVEAAIRGLPMERVQCWEGAFAPFAAEIVRSDMYVGYDSAGQHVAAACGVPLVSVFAGFASPRMFARWRPTGAGRIEVVKVDNPDPARVLEDTLRAIEASSRMMDPRGAGSRPAQSNTPTTLLINQDRPKPHLVRQSILGILRRTRRPTLNRDTTPDQLRGKDTHRVRRPCDRERSVPFPPHPPPREEMAVGVGAITTSRETERQLLFVLPTRNSEDMEPELSSKLNRQVAQSTDPVHSDHVARKRAAMAQRVVRGDSGAEKRRRYGMLRSSRNGCRASQYPRGRRVSIPRHAARRNLPFRLPRVRALADNRGPASARPSQASRRGRPRKRPLLAGRSRSSSGTGNSLIVKSLPGFETELFSWW